MSQRVIEPKIGPVRALVRRAVLVSVRGASGGDRASATLSDLLDSDVASHRAWRKVPRDGA